MRVRVGLNPVVRCKPILVLPSPRDCSELECSDGFVCMVTNGTAICVEPPPLPDACEGLNCEEQNLECRTITILNITTAICGPISDCNRLMCNESEGLECRVVGEGDFSVAVCLVSRNCSILNPVCRRRGLVCEEPQSEGGFSSASCIVPTSCEDVECNPGMVCREFTFNNGDASGGGSASGSPLITLSPSTVMPTITTSTHSTRTPTDSVSTSGPVTATSPTPQTVAVCVPELFRTSCDDLECEEDQVCLFQGYPSRNVSLAACFMQNILSSLTQLVQSCSNTGLEICSLSGQLCVDLVQGGNQVTFSCVQANCTDGDSQGSGTMCTTPDTSCVSVPGSLSGTGIDSVCIETVVQFEFGTTCGDRNDTCPEGLACQEIQLEGEVVGTICSIPTPLLSNSCDGIDCADGQECVQYEAEGTPFLAFCLLSASIDTVLEAALRQLLFGNQ